MLKSVCVSSEHGVIFRENGNQVSLDKSIARGGEGSVWCIQGAPDTLAKIYHKPHHMVGVKLQHMIDHPPHNPFRDIHQHSFAWPHSRLFNKSGECVGFLMPHITSTLTLSQVYHPKLRSKFAPSFHWYYLHTVARNIAALLQALHAQKYIIGDMKTDNILIHPNALVSLVDMDSLQIKTDTATFSCPVQSSDFASPESIHKPRVLTKHHDHFALAILIHLTLMGYHPFVHAPASNRLDYIKRGQWLALSSTPPPFTIPYTDLDPSILNGFQKAFATPQSPHQRPSAQWWVDACSHALEQMICCKNNYQHFYMNTQKQCTWCRYTTKSSVDLFPATETSKPLAQLFQELDALNWKALHTLLHQYPDLQAVPLDHKRQCAFQLCIALAESHQSIENKSRIHKHTSEELMQLWCAYAQAHNLPERDANTFPFPELICVSTKYQSALQELQQYCKRLSEGDSTDPYVAEHITNMFTTLTKQGVTAEHIPHLMPKITYAQSVTKFWQELLSALHSQNEAALANLARSYAKTLAALNMPPSYQQAVSQAVHHQHLIHTINTLLSEKKTHTALEEILAQNISLLHSSFCHDTLVNGQTLTELEGMLKRKKNLSAQLHNAFDHEDYMTIARLWDPHFSEHSGIWSVLGGYAQKGAHMAKKWAPIKRAILEGDDKYLCAHWSEKEFGSIAAQEGLAQQTQEAIKPIFKSVSFPSLPSWPLAYINHKLLHLIFPWPQCMPTITMCVIAWNNTHYPRSIVDMENAIAHHVSSNGAALRHIILPYQNNHAFLSIWPASTIAQNITTVGAPLHVQTSPNTYLFYTTRIIKKSKQRLLIATVTSPTTLHNIKIALYACPAHDPSKNYIIDEYSISVLPASKMATFRIPITNNANDHYRIDGVWGHGAPIPAYPRSSL